MEPVVLKIDKVTLEILQKAGLDVFFRKLSGYDKDISVQVSRTWENDRVQVNGLLFEINADAIAKATGLPNEGRIINREKLSQKQELKKFLMPGECVDKVLSAIYRESLLVSWDRVVIQVMRYITLDGKCRRLFGDHIAILNSIRHGEKLNLPMFIFDSLTKSIEQVKKSKLPLPLHQGLIKLLYINAWEGGPGSLKGMELFKSKGGPATPQKHLLIEGGSSQPAATIKVPTSSKDVVPSECSLPSSGEDRDFKLKAPVGNCKKVVEMEVGFRRSARLKAKVERKPQFTEMSKTEEDNAKKEKMEVDPDRKGAILLQFNFGKEEPINLNPVSFQDIACSLKKSCEHLLKLEKKSICPPAKQ